MTTPPSAASVVIPCLNAREGLFRLLIALQNQTVRPHLEVIVVDNGSTDGSLEVAANLADTVLEVHGGNGSSAARNVGLQRATHPLVLTTDADCVPVDPGWALAHIAAIHATPPDVLASAGPLRPLPTADKWAMREDVTPNAPFQPDGSPSWAVNGSACYRKMLLLEIGGYPDYGANDAAVGHVALARGLRYIWVPQAVVFHENGRGLGAYVRQRSKYGMYAAEIHGRPPSWGGYAAQAARHIAAGLRPAVRGDLTEAVAQVAGATATHWGAVSALRRPDRPPPLVDCPTNS